MSALSAALLLFIFISVCFFPHIGRQAAPVLRRTIGFNAQYRTSGVAEHMG